MLDHNTAFKKESWIFGRYNETHRIEVSRHDGSQGKNIWCLYAYIFKKHPLYEKIKSEVGPKVGRFFDHYKSDTISLMGWHDCNFYDELEHCLKLGADYAHICDEHITCEKEPRYVGEVFEDAENLMEFLSREVSPNKT